MQEPFSAWGASEAMARGNVDSLVKLIAGCKAAGIATIDEAAVSHSRGRGVQLKIKSDLAEAALDVRSDKASDGTRART
jgi:hypothetical protein